MSMSHNEVISEGAIVKIEALREIIRPDDNIVMWKEPFDPGLLFNKVFSQKEKRTGLFKPDGVWYACGFDWLDWVLSEMPQWAHPYIYNLKIDKSDFKIIRTPGELVKFAKKYVIGDVSTSMKVNWSRLAENYTGIEICPYQPSLRHEFMFYYGWDIASGCVWDTHTIKAVDEIKVP